MPRIEGWVEGARIGDPSYSCPKGHAGAFTKDFKYMGKRRFQVCGACRGTYVDGKVDSFEPFAAEPLSAAPLRDTPGAVLL